MTCTICVNEKAIQLATLMRFMLVKRNRKRSLFDNKTDHKIRKKYIENNASIGKRKVRIIKIMVDNRFSNVLPGFQFILKIE